MTVTFPDTPACARALVDEAIPDYIVKKLLGKTVEVVQVSEFTLQIQEEDPDINNWFISIRFLLANEPQ